VKNNLQVVMSLLSLQAAQSKDPTVREALSRAQARINAMALVHRMLNEDEDQTSVDLQRLLNELTRQIVEGMGSDCAGIAVKVDVMALSVAGETAVPLALFVVEALTNVFKHAFPQADARGTVSVILKPSGTGHRLTIKDDGVGFSHDSIKPGIGDRLLKVFARQVHGTASIESRAGGGTVVELEFKEGPASDTSNLSRPTDRIST
jgi:two-component sensor histidine kinase